MATHLVVAQVIIGITLILMIIGRTPLFMTAMIGAACAAIVGGDSPHRRGGYRLDQIVAHRWA